MQNHIETLHAEALRAAGRYNQAEADLIEILQRADRERIYLHFNYKSLFEYVVQCLRLAEGTAYNLITVSRKAVEVPALKEAIQAGKLTVSKARKMTAVLTSANQAEWIQKAAVLSTRRLETEVARAIQPEKERNISVHLSLTPQLHEKIKRAQDLECQRQKKAVSLESMLEEVLELYLERQDPVRRAARILKSKPAHPVQLVTGQVRKSIPALSEHRVSLRDQGQCVHRDTRTGERCMESKWIELHHIKPRSQGGTHAPENLSTLCSAHHRLMHFREGFG